MAGIQSMITRHSKYKEHINHNEEKNQSIRTELVNKDIKTVIITIIQIFKKLSTDVKKVF